MHELALYGSRETLHVVVAYALVDDDDYDSLCRYRWRFNKDGYAMRRAGGREILLHRVLLGLARGDSRFGDHINRNRLDNQRNNLRILTCTESAQNKSPRCNAKSIYRGVSWDGRNQCWKAAGRLNGQAFNIGTFKDEQAAALAAAAWRATHMPFSAEAAA